MAKAPKKVIVFGLDAPMADRLYKYCKEGELPTLAKVLDNGIWAKNALVPLPTITPPNWTSIATGAWPSTHGVTDFWVHNPGDPLDLVHGGFYSGDVKSEWFWDAIARAGKKTVLVNWPTTWPPVVKDGYQIGGGGVHTNMMYWPHIVDLLGGPDVVPPELITAAEGDIFGFARHGVEIKGSKPGRSNRNPWSMQSFSGLSRERLFSAKKFRSGPGEPLPVEFKEPEGWSNIPPAKQVLEADLLYKPMASSYGMHPVTWHMLVLDTKGDGYNKILICDGKDASSPMAELNVGQWSPIIVKEFKTELGGKKASFAFKLIELSKDAADFKLFHSAVCALDGWSYPESLASEIPSQEGMPYPQPPGWSGLLYGWYDADTALEVIEFERRWLSDACTYILKNKPWDLFMMHYHAPDHAWHAISEKIDPVSNKNAEEVKFYQRLELETYKSCDRLAAEIFACADEDETMFIIVSDHGAKAKPPYFPEDLLVGSEKPLSNPEKALLFVPQILEDEGLLVRDKEGYVDWTKTKAVAQRVVWVYINVKGRDPDGIVEPGEEYRKVQDHIIKALMEYVEPETGERPIAMALRKEDARVMGIHGDYVGDVVYAISEKFGDEHGPFLPTAEYGFGSMRGVLAMSGPGIKKGVELERTVWIMDMVPTISYLAGWPVPKDAEGAVIFQALEEPDPKK